MWLLSAQARLQCKSFRTFSQVSFADLKCERKYINDQYRGVITQMLHSQCLMGDCRLWSTICRERGIQFQMYGFLQAGPIKRRSKILTITDNEKQKRILQNDPQKYLAYRKKIESELNSRFRFILNGSEEQANARAVRPPSRPSALLAHS